MKDLFETPELIPPEVQIVLDKAIGPDGETSYQALAECLTEVNKLGYTFDYDLSATPFDLKPITS